MLDASEPPDQAARPNVRVAEVLEKTIRRRDAGERLSSSAVVAAHPELQLELETKLRILERVDAAERLARHSGTEPKEVRDFELPNFIPAYPFAELLHRGGQGVVYRARHERTGRDVAVKILRDGPLCGPDALARFEREVRILSRLNHPNIVTIHDTGIAAGFRYFVMDYVDGEPLDAFVVAHVRTLNEKLRLFVKICDAVHAAHLHGIIHRDLKPSNIRINHRGEPHILDFGLAKVDADDAYRWGADPGVTVSGQFLGSLPWASPEQAEGSPDRVDLRTDVYSLGVILFYMLTNHFPYPVVGSIRSILTHILETEPIRLRSVCPKLDEDIETIVLRSLSKGAKDRYQSVQALGDDVGRYLNRQPILARAPSSIYQLKKLIVRHKLPVALLLILFATVTGFAAAMSILYGSAALSRNRAQEAEVLAEQRRLKAERETESAKAIKEFLVQDLLSSARPEVARGQEVTVEEVLTRSAKRIEHAFENQPEVEASIRSTLGNVYLSLGKYRNAEEQLLAATTLLSDARGSDDLETLQVRHAWILAGLSCGPDWRGVEKAKEFFLDCERTLGRNHELTLNALVRYAEAQWLAGQSAEAIQSIGEGLGWSRQVLGDDHGLTIGIQNALAGWTLQKTGRRREMESVFRDILDRTRAALGDDHPETFQATVNLGGILSEQRRFAEAEPLLRDGYEGLRRVLGETHPRMLFAIRNLGLMLREKGMVREAIALSRKALSIARNIAGSDDPITLGAMYDTGTNLFRGGCFCEADDLLRDYWETYHRTFGDKSTNAAHALEVYSFAQLNLGRIEQAEEGFRCADLVRRETDGASDAWCLRQLIRSLSEQGRSEEARPFGEQLLELRRAPAMLPDADAYALNSYAHDLLTVEPADLRQPQEALRVALLAYERSNDEYHYNRFTLARAYEANACLDEAVESARRALAHSPLEHSTERAEYEAILVRCLEQEGDMEGAERVYRDTLAARGADKSAGDHDVSVSLSDLGNLLLKHEKYSEAEPVLRECLEKRLDLFADPADNDCPRTLECEIARTMLDLGRSLMGLERYNDAEPYLLDAFDRLSQSNSCHTAYLPESARLLIDLYRNLDSPEPAAPYTTVLSRVVPQSHP